MDEGTDGPTESRQMAIQIRDCALRMGGTVPGRGVPLRNRPVAPLTTDTAVRTGAPDELLEGVQKPVVGDSMLRDEAE